MSSRDITHSNVLERYEKYHLITCQKGHTRQVITNNTSTSMGNNSLKSLLSQTFEKLYVWI